MKYYTQNKLLTHINTSKHVQQPQSAVLRRKLLGFQKLTEWRETLNNLTMQIFWDTMLRHLVCGSVKQSKKNLTLKMKMKVSWSFKM